MVHCSLARPAAGTSRSRRSPTRRDPRPQRSEDGASPRIPQQGSSPNGIETNREYYSLATGASDCPPGSFSSCVPGRLRAINTRLANQSSEPVQNVTYRYNRNGNLARKAPPGPLVNAEVYIYDGFERLTQRLETFPGGGVVAEEFTYDLGGNITSKSGVGDYDYDTPGRPYNLDRVGGGAQNGGTSYQYDLGGNQVVREGAGIPGGVQELNYDAFDMPWRSWNPSAPTQGVTELEYDGTGARIIKRKRAGIAPDALTTELTLTIGEMYEQVTAFAPGTQNVASRKHNYRIYTGGKQVAQVQRVEQSGVVDPAQTKILYLHDDQLGSTSSITDEDGEEIEERTFRPFGEVAIDFSATGVTSGFTGHTHDPELGLVNMRGRLYDPRIARFVTADPFVTNPTSQGLNRYSYVENNPLNFTDPSGFQAQMETAPPPPAPPAGAGAGAFSLPTYTPPGPDEGSGTWTYEWVPFNRPNWAARTNQSAPSRPTSSSATDWVSRGPEASDVPNGLAQAEATNARNAYYAIHGMNPPTDNVVPSSHGGRYDAGFGGAPTTMSQPTTQPSGPSNGSWNGGSMGGSSSSTPAPTRTPSIVPQIIGGLAIGTFAAAVIGGIATTVATGGSNIIWGATAGFIVGLGGALATGQSVEDSLKAAAAGALGGAITGALGAGAAFVAGGALTGGAGLGIGVTGGLVGAAAQLSTKAGVFGSAPSGRDIVSAGVGAAAGAAAGPLVPGAVSSGGKEFATGVAGGLVGEAAGAAARSP